MQECWGIENGKGNVDDMSGCVNKNIKGHGECRRSSSMIGCEVLRGLWLAGGPSLNVVWMWDDSRFLAVRFTSLSQIGECDQFVRMIILV